MAADLCPHRMNPAWCAFCRSTGPTGPKPRLPQRVARTIESEFSKETIRRLEDLHFAIVRTNEGRNSASFHALDRYTHKVHILGFPFVWAIEKILDLAPNIKEIQMLPAFLDRIQNGLHHAICAARGVKIIAGHVRPEGIWQDESIRAGHYAKQQRFMLALAEGQKSLFDELLRFGFEEAEITARYFCLNGEEPRYLRLIGEDYGYNPQADHLISAKINGVLLYLDGGFKTGRRSEQIARSLRQRVERLRVIVAQEDAMRNLCRRLGLENLPQGFPLARLAILERILEAGRSGELGRLKLRHPRAHKTLTLRFGMDRYRTLEEVGQELGFTRERARQLEVQAFKFLGIVDE